MNKDLVDTVITFTELLQQAKLPGVATWKPFFISKCTDWCVYIETELSILDTEESDQVRQAAQGKSKLEIPPLFQLEDALHLFFITLLQNVFVSNSLYLYIMKNYRFLTIPDKDILVKDLSLLSSQSATQAILSDMLQELS